MARPGPVPAHRRGGNHDHAAVAEAVHRRDLADRRDAHRSGARRARPGAGGAELHGDPDRGAEERAGRVAGGQDPRRRALADGGGAVARGDRGQDSARALFRQRARSAGSSVEPTRGSNVINLTFTAADPIFAQAAANAFAQAYMDVSVDLRVAPARQSATFLEEQAKTLRANLEKAQATLSAVPADQGHRRHRRAARPGERPLLGPHRRSSPWRRRSRSRPPPGSATAAPRPRPTCCRAASVQSLKSQLAAAQTKLTEASNLLGKNHPTRHAARGAGRRAAAPARGRDPAGLRRHLGQQPRQLAEGRRAADAGRRAEEAAALAARRQGPDRRLPARRRGGAARLRRRRACASPRSTWRGRTTRPTPGCSAPRSSRSSRRGRRS